MIDEGVVKFQCEWISAPPPSGAEIKELNLWRQRLYARGLIGIYDNGIAFGNISKRISVGKEFIISGTQTGGLPQLKAEHYTTITAHRIEDNYIRCRGPVRASSESLTHAMIYELDATINAVVHVHHRGLWHRLKGKLPTTSERVSYGTPEMAREVERLYRKSDLWDKKILVMGGHEEGIISFGTHVEDVSLKLLGYL